MFNQNKYITVKGENIQNPMKNTKLEITQALAAVVFRGYEYHYIKDFEVEYKRNIILMSYLFLNFDRRKLFVHDLLLSLEIGKLKGFKHMGLLRKFRDLKWIKLGGYTERLSIAIKHEIAMDYIESLKFPVSEVNPTDVIGDKNTTEFTGTYDYILERERKFVGTIFSQNQESNEFKSDYMETFDNTYDFQIGEDGETLELDEDSPFAETFTQNYSREELAKRVKARFRKKNKGEYKHKKPVFEEFKKFMIEWLEDKINSKREEESSRSNDGKDGEGEDGDGSDKRDDDGDDDQNSLAPTNLSKSPQKEKEAILNETEPEVLLEKKEGPQNPVSTADTSDDQKQNDNERHDENFGDEEDKKEESKERIKQKPKKSRKMKKKSKLKESRSQTSCKYR